MTTAPKRMRPAAMAVTPVLQEPETPSPPVGDLGGLGLEEDRTLLQGYRDGDRAALKIVFERYLPLVMRALRGGARGGAGQARMAPGVDEMEIESLAQETFLRAFSPAARTQYDGLRPFSAYIATIAKNLLVDEARRRSRRPNHVALDDVEYQLTDEGAEERQDRQLEDEALRTRLATFFRGLSVAEQQVYTARFEEQQSLREAARTTGIGLFALRKIDVRLRVRLLDALQREGFLGDTGGRTVKTSVVDRIKTPTDTVPKTVADEEVSDA